MRAEEHMVDSDIMCHHALFRLRHLDPKIVCSLFVPSFLPQAIHFAGASYYDYTLLLLFALLGQ